MSEMTADERAEYYRQLNAEQDLLSNENQCGAEDDMDQKAWDSAYDRHYDDAIQMNMSKSGAEVYASWNAEQEMAR